MAVILLSRLCCAKPKGTFHELDNSTLLSTTVLKIVQCSLKRTEEGGKYQVRIVFIPEGVAAWLDVTPPTGESSFLLILAAIPGDGLVLVFWPSIVVELV